MKKVLKTIAAIPVLAGLVSVPAMAADQLDLSGEMRVRAWMLDSDGDDDSSFMDHRLRMYGKFKVNDNVQVHFRTDLTEEVWGSTDSTYGAGRLPEDSMQVDRGFLQLENDSMRLRAGLQYVGFSPSYAIDTQDEGLLFTIKNDVAPVHIFGIMDGSNEFENEIVDEDWIMGLATTPTFGNVSTQFFGGYLMATQNGVIDEETDIVTSLDEDRDIYILGAAGTMDAGMTTITAEINMFGGDYNDSTDAMGLQGWVSADVKVSDALTITPRFYYAMAADDDEKQIVVLGNNFNDWDPLFEIGVGMDNEEIGLGRPFDWTGEGAGAIGASLATSYKVSEALTLAAGANYITVEDDDIIDDSVYAFSAGFNYGFMGNATLKAQIEYLDFDLDDDDDGLRAGVHLGVKF